MDLRALLSRFEDEMEQRRNCVACVFTVVLLVAFTAVATLFGYNLFVDPDQSIGHIKFSMEPVAHTGFGTGGDGGAAAAPPPSFNVTLHATSTFKHAFCTSSGGATLQAVFSGVTVAVGQVAPFCVEPIEPAVVAGTASSAWTALPQDFQERIDRGGGEKGAVELEVNLSFRNEFKGEMWVRCRAMLDANLSETPCRTFIRTPFIPR